MLTNLLLAHAKRGHGCRFQRSGDDDDCAVDPHDGSKAFRKSRGEVERRPSTEHAQKYQQR